VEVDVPSFSTGPEPVIVLTLLEAVPWMKVTVFCVTLTGETIDKVFVSAFVEVMVQVETPEAFDEEQTL
jgi:hypothetical protein